MAKETHKQSMPAIDALYAADQRSEYYAVPIDPNDFELNYEALSNHYSTQISFSTDVWREAFLYASVRASAGGAAYRIPGALLSDPGLVYVVGSPNASVTLTIDAVDITFRDGSTTTRAQLDSAGLAHVLLIAR